MPRRFGILALVGALILVTGDARAQAPAGMEETVRPATTSIYGDTGLWFVPTGEVLRDRTWSASAYRLNWDVRQGFTDISHFEGTFAYGVKGRAEIFGAIRFVTRIDRDTRPIFGFGGERFGGVDNNYPFVREGWIGNKFGDTFLGAKVNLLSESRQHPVALALRGMVKVPTGSADNQSGTGKLDAQFDFIASKEIASTVEVSGSIGYRHRGDPDEYDLSSGIPFGIGAQFPTRSPLKFTTEWFGEIFNKDVVTRTVSPAPASIIGSDLSVPLVTSNLPLQSTLMFGATWQTQKGLFFGAGIDWSAKAEDREDLGVDSDDNFGTKFGWQFRLGYHPGVAGIPVALPPPPPPPPPPPAPQHTLTVDAQCNPCTVDVGATSKVTATAMDSIGCVITYQWSAPTGHVRQSGAAEHRLDGPQHARHRARHCDRHLSDGQHEGVRHGQHPGRAARGEDDYVRGRLLRLRPLHPDRCRTAHSRAGGRGDAGGPDAARSHRRAHVQHRHGRVQPGARRSPRPVGSAISGVERHRGRSTDDRQLR